MKIYSLVFEVIPLLCCIDVASNGAGTSSASSLPSTRNTRRRASNASTLLGQRLRRWAGEPTLCAYFVFAGYI